jgi:hypothetical protein
MPALLTAMIRTQYCCAQVSHFVGDEPSIRRFLVVVHWFPCPAGISIKQNTGPTAEGTPLQGSSASSCRVLTAEFRTDHDDTNGLSPIVMARCHGREYLSPLLSTHSGSAAEIITSSGRVESKTAPTSLTAAVVRLSVRFSILVAKRVSASRNMALSVSAVAGWLADLR